MARWRANAPEDPTGLEWGNCKELVGDVVGSGVLPQKMDASLEVPGNRAAHTVILPRKEGPPGLCVASMALQLHLRASWGVHTMGHHRWQRKR